MSVSPLVSVEALQQNSGDGEDIRFIDCQASLADHLQGRRDWLSGHLPGAVHLDLEQDLSGTITAETGRHPLPRPEDLEMALGRSGIHPAQPLVAYDNDGGIFAVRCWWLLRWLGHQNVRVLDGGLEAWRVAGGVVETGPVRTEPTTYRGQREAMPSLSTESLQRGLGQQALLLLDARSGERFRGEKEAIDPVAGHIPGAINHPFAHNLDEQGRWRTPAELKTLYQTLIGDWPVNTVVHMCGSGVTACHNLFAMEYAGLGGSALYAGSWSEWIRDPARPVARD
ncbi:sulfurtransferase [Natronospira bacteriovora]|uniref:Sulfurtransferase n=1 Tax=Natronospira bacteriovora TaxID=3069753 RepID=A0ABU0WCK6_9GAMM|nr:sulfurtransferase [Natronospira sp. AB-CW4]MDQ2070665.1 sulfurtransferase [Natronospira sp. AB-CW4]